MLYFLISILKNSVKNQEESYLINLNFHELCNTRQVLNFK